MLKESIKSPIFTDGFRLINLLCQSYPPHCVVLRLELSEWIWKKSHREQPIVRLAMCERSSIREKHAKNSYHMVCHHTLSKNGIISYHQIVISYQNMSFHIPWYVIIPTIVISYCKGINSYQYMSFHTAKVLIHISTCHCILVLFHIKTCHFISLGMSSYQQLSFHTVKVSIHTSTCHFIP
jgi:hypothetical protein